MVARADNTNSVDMIIHRKGRETIQAGSPHCTHLVSRIKTTPSVAAAGVVCDSLLFMTVTCTPEYSQL